MAISKGVYSLYNGWLAKPEPEDLPELPDIKSEYTELLNQAKSCETVEDIDNFMDKIYQIRQSSLLTDGEFGVGNLCFKELRNNGVLQDLKDKKVELENKEMSLGEDFKPITYNLILDESDLLLEYNRKDLRNFIGDEYAAKFFDLRNKLQAPENDLGYWIKNKTSDELKQFIDDWESGATKSKSQKKKEQRLKGAELIFNGKGWKVYFVTEYNAAKQLGSGTTWCITGRYRGAEERGEFYFNDYLKRYNLNGGYYFMFDTLNNDPATGDYEKYCIGVSKDNKVQFLYNGFQDSDIMSYGIPGQGKAEIPYNRRIQPLKDLGIEINYHSDFIIKDGVLIKYSGPGGTTIVKIPEDIIAIGKLAFEDRYIGDIIFPEPSKIKTIGAGAFSSTRNVKKIELPDSVEELKTGTFLRSQVEKVKLPINLKSIPKYCCAYCDNLESVILPNAVEYIDDLAFEESPNVVLRNCNDYALDFAKRNNIKYEDPETGAIER